MYSTQPAKLAFRYKQGRKYRKWSCLPLPQPPGKETNQVATPTPLFSLLRPCANSASLLRTTAYYSIFALPIVNAKETSSQKPACLPSNTIWFVLLRLLKAQRQHFCRGSWVPLSPLPPRSNAVLKAPCLACCSPPTHPSPIWPRNRVIHPPPEGGGRSWFLQPRSGHF